MIKRKNRTMYTSSNPYSIIEEISEYYNGIPEYLGEFLLDLVEDVLDEIIKTDRERVCLKRGDFAILYNKRYGLYTIFDKRGPLDIMIDCFNAEDEIFASSGEEVLCYPGAGEDNE